MRNHIYSIFVLLIVLTACVETIDVELKEKNLNILVVEGRITTEQKAHKILLSRTASYFSNEETPRELGATVTISDESDSYPLTASLTSPGTYETASTFAGQVGHTYTLDIVTSDGEQYTASAYLDTVPHVDSITYYYMPNDYYEYFGGSPGYYNMSLHAFEPQGKGNIYMFEVYLKDEGGNWQWQNDTLIEAIMNTFSDDYADGVYLDGVDFFFLEQEYINRDTIDAKVNMFSISEEYMDFTYEVAFETDFSGGMMGGIPANVMSNVSNGALGFFYAADISGYEFTIYKDSLEVVID